MRRWAFLIGTAAVAFLFVECGGDSSTEGDLDVPPLPDRVASGETGLDGGANPSDGAQDALDAAPPACDITKAFAPPVALTEFDAPSYRSAPRLSGDELAIYYATIGAGGIGLMTTATRPFTTAPFAGQTVLPQSGTANDNDPSVSADHLSVWWNSDRGGAGNMDLYTASRATASGPFGPATAVPAVNLPNAQEVHAYMRVAANELWFASDRPGGAGSYDIYVSVRTAGVFAAPTRIAELSSASQDVQPQPSEDGLRVVFASDRPGGLGGRDLYIARRASVTAAWGAPTPITELNSSAGEGAGWLSADQCRIWFCSARGNTDGHMQIYFAQRPAK